MGNSAGRGADLVATMEDVLEVYQRPQDPQRPLVCLDETSKQLIVETRAPIPAKPGRKARHDYEYERNGVANLFMLFAPLEGWRHVKVTDRHTAIDYAHTLRDLSDVHFSDAVKIVLVQDNLNTHKPASLYEAFPAPAARRLVERFEWHYTPKHGSWLDIAGIRTRRARVAMSGSPHRRQKTPRPRSHRMAGPPQQAPRQGQLAIQNRRRPRQAEKTVPSVRVTRATRINRYFVNSYFLVGPPAPRLAIPRPDDGRLSAAGKTRVPVAMSCRCRLGDQFSLHRWINGADFVRSMIESACDGWRRSSASFQSNRIAAVLRSRLGNQTTVPQHLCDQAWAEVTPFGVAANCLDSTQSIK